MIIDEIFRMINELPGQNQSLLFHRISDLSNTSKQMDLYNIREGIHESKPILCPYYKHRKWIKYGSYRSTQKYRSIGT